MNQVVKKKLKMKASVALLIEKIKEFELCFLLGSRMTLAEKRELIEKLREIFLKNQ